METTKRLFNERPSEILNIGSDIPDAARHRNDTYETPEELRTKAFKKSSSKDLKALKGLAIDILNETNFLEVVNSYEFGKLRLSSVALSSFETPNVATVAERMEALRLFIVSLKGTIEPKEFNKLASAYNRTSKRQRKNRYYLKFETALKYFETKFKDTFIERNGAKGNWKSNETSLDAARLGTLQGLVKAVQFGNSVPDSERAYCSMNLLESIKTLSTVLNVDLKDYGFSFGARGNGQSVAFYQHGGKVLSFNRHCDGAFMHEVGHAVDYSLNLVSATLPTEIRRAYRDKLKASGIKSGFEYYMGSKEIFARLFEQYVSKLLGKSCTPFMYSVFDPAVMPTLDAESTAWLESVLKPILKGAS